MAFMIPLSSSSYLSQRSINGILGLRRDNVMCPVGSIHFIQFRSLQLKWGTVSP